MFTIHKEKIEWGGHTLTLETGKIARQADAAVVATYGETTVLATVVAEKTQREDIDFFPLTVHYQEKTYAAGKIPGGYLKREGRPSEKETLVSRLIDRPIRPLFEKGFKSETQIIATVLSYDMENNPDIVAMIAVSAALTLSGVPFRGPIGAARIGYKNGEYILNPTIDQQSDSALDLVVAGTDSAVLMVESEADRLSEDEMLNAVMFGHQQFQPVIDAIIALAERAAREPREMTYEDRSDLYMHIEKLADKPLRKAYAIADKMERQNTVAQIRETVYEALIEQSEELKGDVSYVRAVEEQFKTLEKTIVRGDILKNEKRIDGRGLADVRPIHSEVGMLPRTHGAALFTRGETQALVVTTLGTGDDEQLVDALEGTFREKFILHYNFPPFSVGETGRIGFTGRREIGHGKLAWRAIKAILPQPDQFPYTIRLVSEITESNGSSSMATVCGSSLALMDAGVPISGAVAGIAMGLIKEGDQYAVLSDILGDEDHLGDMDFKVAGTENGITALQMDIKITGITEEIMRDALNQAREGRLHILQEMSKALSQSREDIGDYAPRIETMTIAVDKIREVIGTGGKVIREIVDVTGAKVDIDDSGMIKIASSDAETIRKAKEWILSIVAEPEEGKIYNGTVVKIADFGAFVNFMGRRDGLVHVSELIDGRPKKVNDVVKEGDKVKVKLLGFDQRGKIRLSMRAVDQKSGVEISGYEERRKQERPGRS